MMYYIVLSKRFKRDLKKLIKKHPQVKSKVERQLELLSTNPKHKSLKLHKLSGMNNWSISIAFDIRLIFTVKRKYILCTRIGAHDEVC